MGTRNRNVTNLCEKCGAGFHPPYAKMTQRFCSAICVVGSKRPIDHEKTRRQIHQQTIKNGDCWEWTGSKTRFGYGRISIRRQAKIVHRVSYELFKGLIPDGLYVCHSCDNPACCNPDHLWLGKAVDNNVDKSKKGRAGPWPTKTKLTPGEAKEIRSSPARVTDLAIRFGVSKAAISKIKSGKLWKKA